MKGMRPMSQGQRCGALGLVVIASMCSLALVAQAGAPADLVANKLKEQFPITVFSGDASQVVTAGAVVTLQKDGFLVFRLPVPAHPISTYKNGKLSQGFGDTFAACLANGLNQPNGCKDVPQKTLATGEKFWISAIVVGKKDIVLVAVTDPYDDGRYIGELKFPFGKGSVPSPDEALSMVSEVVTPVPIQNQQAPDQGMLPAQGPAPAEPSQDQFASIQGTYLREGKTSDTMELGPNGVFALVQNGRRYDGNYTVQGEILTVWGPKIRGQQRCSLVGNVITDPGKTIWEKQSAPQNVADTPAATPSQVPLPEIAPPPPPPPADAPPPTIALGQTVDQVTAGFGQPVRAAKLGVKKIFYYKDMKVTFTNGKVSNIE